MVTPPVGRVAWGTALVLFPEFLLRRCSPTPPGPVGRLAVRALGVRHILQGALAARGHVPPTAGAVTDGMHAASMAGLALRSERWRRAALTDFCIACALAAASWHPGRP